MTRASGKPQPKTPSGADAIPSNVNARDWILGGAFVLCVVAAGAFSLSTVLRWWFGFAGIAPSWQDLPAVRVSSAVALALELVLWTYGYFVEPMRLGATHLTIESGKTAKRTRLLFMSDIHVEEGWHMRAKLVALARAQEPDLILMGGDYLNSTSHKSIEILRETASDLAGIAPAYAVAGNADSVRLGGIEALRSAGVDVLSGQNVDLEPGIGVWGIDFLDRSQLGAASGALSPERFNICLTHEPSLMHEAADAGFDLYLAGHTHGGQVRLPLYGAVMTMAEKGKSVEMGRYDVGALTAYVVRGVGLEGGLRPMHVRFLCPPEILVVDLVPA